MTGPVYLPPAASLAKIAIALILGTMDSWPTYADRYLILDVVNHCICPSE